MIRWGGPARGDALLVGTSVVAIMIATSIMRTIKV